MNKRYGILIVSVTILVLGFVGTASATNWSVDGSGGADFTGIQDAINNAKDGATILVYSGVYYENVVVDKSVTLKGIGHPVVDANNSGSAITFTADGITLVGFTATNSGKSLSDAGINVNTSNNTITGNNVRNNNYDGIRLTYSSSNNTITGNNVRNNNHDGIRLTYSRSNNTITGNNVSNNNHDGIRLTFCSNDNTITGNNASNNNYDGIHLTYSSNNNTITGNNVSNNNYYGIHLDRNSSNNTITGNNVRNNNHDGICLDYSSNNTIYLNNFINNTDNVYSYKSTNIWNSPLEITYTYDGTTYKSYLGNYWDDYEGTDGDGIGDTQYSIDSDSDKNDDYPLMTPFENYFAWVLPPYSWGFYFILFYLLPSMR